MSVILIARSCLETVDRIRAVTESADAFGPEARALHGKLAELRPLFEDLIIRKREAKELAVALEGIQASLGDFFAVLQTCSNQGPLQILLSGDDLLRRMVDSCLCVRAWLTQLQGLQLSTIAAAQAKIVAAELSSSTVNFATLRKLQSLRLDLQEEAERVRLGMHDESAFSASVVRLVRSCSAAQLRADAAFLQGCLVDAKERSREVQAYFCTLAHATISELVVKEDSGSSGRISAVPVAPAPRASGSGGQPETKHAAAQIVEQLSSGSTPQTQRLVLLEALCEALNGPQPERAQTVEALDNTGVSAMVRLVSTSIPAVRSASLRVLSALLTAEPARSGQLVTTRGIQVLVHSLTTFTDDLQRNAAGPAFASATVVVSVSPQVASAYKRGTRAVEQKQAVLGSQSSPGRRSQTPGSAGEELAATGQGAEEEVCLQAVMLLRQLLPEHMAEVLATGAIKALCRLAGAHVSGRLTSAAIAALAEAATAGQAAVQMLQGRLLVALADARSSDRPSEAAAAVACTEAVMQHPARLRRAHSPQDAQLCSDMGRSCDAASTTSLLDMLVGATREETASGADCSQGVLCGLVELLPFCLHSADSRAALLQHRAALRVLLDRVGHGDGTAALALKRAAGDDASKSAVARELSQALTSCTSGVGSRQAAALACCLADVLRPAGRDRAEARWSTEACSESERYGALRAVFTLAHCGEAACRASGLACLYTFTMYGNQGLKSALSEAGAIMLLVDAVKLELVGLPDSLQPPLCQPNTLNQAAAEALAMLASTSDKLRKDVCMQLSTFLASTSAPLASSACHALLVLLEMTPAAAAVLVTQGVMAPLVSHLTQSQSAIQASGEGSDADAQSGLAQRTVSILWALCRGGGAAVDGAVEAGAVAALLQRLSKAGQDVSQRVEAAAALGPLLKKSVAARDQACGQEGVAKLLQLARTAPFEVPLWEEALAALAALASLHVPSRVETTRALRQMLMRGSSRDMTVAAVIVARMSSGPSGREVLLAEDIVDPLVKLLTIGDERAKAAAAKTICQLAVPASVQLPPSTAQPEGGTVRPRFLLVRAGAVPALLGVLRHALEAQALPTSSASSTTSSASSSRSAAAAEPASSTLLGIAEALESLAGGEEGVQAIRAAGGVEVLKEIVARGKRRNIPAPVATAASSTLLQCM